jgi:D-lyxose ketol-isomerase
MKRSEINDIIRSADAFLRERQFYLPPFAYWTPEEWQAKGPEAAEIVRAQMGWDITDFGGGDFYQQGLFLFTIRNGFPQNLVKGEGKLYAEKVLIVEKDQVTPMHFHWSKMEDIINRGGGTLVIKLFGSTTEENIDHYSPVEVVTDGVIRRLEAGGALRLQPGESITLTPGLYHAFWAEGERTLVGEVSLVNDDTTDNHFHHAQGRFPTIEEDVPPLHLLVGDYARYYRHA